MNTANSIKLFDVIVITSLPRRIDQRIKVGSVGTVLDLYDDGYEIEFWFLADRDAYCCGIGKDCVRVATEEEIEADSKS